LTPNPFFSIIIPTFNSAEVLDRAINSVLSQRFIDFEILIMDGVSEDNTVKLAHTFHDERIRVFCEEDTGIYDAMNKGTSRSRGRWLLFLGSDDQLFDDDVLETVYQAIEAHPASKLIFGNVRTSTGGIQSYRNYNYLKLLDMCICHQAIFYHRSLFAQRKYDIRYRVCGDWDFNLRVFRRKNVPLHMDKTIAVFNVTGASNNWGEHPEYYKYFKSKTKSILRYRGIGYLLYYYFYAIFTRLKHFVRLRAKKSGITSKPNE